MSDNPPPGDEPTRAHRPYEEPHPTRVERPVTPYESPRESRQYAEPPRYADDPARSSIWAPLVAVALVATLLGLGLGYLFFHENGLRGSGEETTTTSTTISTTTTTQPQTTTTTRLTTTTQPTTSTTAATTTSTVLSLTTRPA